jgi:hypothetical protein
VKRALLGAFLLYAHAAHGLCPAPPTKACNAWFAADQVFLGKVTRIEYINEGKADAEVVYTVAVEKPLKGKAARVEKVRSLHDSGRWGGGLGDRLVVFAREGRVGGFCSELENPRHVTQTLRAIERLRRTVDSTIEGEVVTGLPGPPRVVAGVEVRVAGEDGQTYGDTTNANGRFVINRIPPGRYRFELPIRASELGRQDAEGFSVAAGECAQFQLAVP